MIVSEYRSDDEEEHSGWDQKGSGILEPDSEPKKKSKNPIKAHAEDRQEKLLVLILKLAAIRGYNQIGNIKLPDGSYMPKTSISPLLQYVLSREKPVPGVNEFIQLLREAGVTPDLVTNENVKHKLISTTGEQYSRPYTHNAINGQENPAATTRQLFPDSDMDILPSSRKRRLVDYDDTDDEEEVGTQPPKLFGPYHPVKKAIRQSDRKKRRVETELLKAAETPYESDSNDGW